MSSELVLPGRVNGPSPDGPAGTVCGTDDRTSMSQAVCSRSPVAAIKKTDKKFENSVRNRKVWTKLNNGLFAWRVRKTGNKTSTNNLGEQVPQSASAKPKWEPVISRGDNINSGNFSTKRKLNFGGVRHNVGRESESMLGLEDKDLEMDYWEQGAKKLKK